MIVLKLFACNNTQCTQGAKGQRGKGAKVDTRHVAVLCYQLLYAKAHVSGDAQTMVMACSELCGVMGKKLGVLPSLVESMMSIPCPAP